MITDLIPIWKRLLHGFLILFLYSMAIDCIKFVIAGYTASSNYVSVDMLEKRNNL